MSNTLINELLSHISTFVLIILNIEIIYHCGLKFYHYKDNNILTNTHCNAQWCIAQLDKTLVNLKVIFSDISKCRIDYITILYQWSLERRK